jgi:hypothetical protein
VCYLDDGSGDFFVDCSTPERKNAFVDKVYWVQNFHRYIVGLPKVEYLLKNNPPLVAIELSVSC